MRNVLLAAVSAVAILGVSPEAKAVAAAKMIMLGEYELALTPHVYEGANYWWAPYGNYWVVGSHMMVPNMEAWKTIDMDGKSVYLYGVSAAPHLEGGIFAMPFANWAGYSNFVAAHMMDAALGNAVKDPFVKERSDEPVVK
ncbi:hypothetical protein Bealeia1_01718 [Candidatus Bealeia paramacronuclearis]|uniref:Uncharacterized protein n=2 Tax=Candidatus Bealeia paramacronuclearis TaxID=1921001 RepID=A0ABZ2C4V0_9PROT|nr:hypothetical protein [Candidatus Bealeia paramacronuclearis]